MRNVAERVRGAGAIAGVPFEARGLSGGYSGGALSLAGQWGQVARSRSRARRAAAGGKGGNYNARGATMYIIIKGKRLSRFRLNLLYMIFVVNR